MRDAAGWVLGVTAGAALALGYIALVGRGSASVEATHPIIPAGGARTHVDATDPPRSDGATPTARELSLPLIEATAQAPAPGAFDERMGIVVYGNVTDAAHQPVHVRDEDNSVFRLTGETGESRWIALDASGAYAVAGLQPGAWRLRVMVNGFRPFERTLTLAASKPVVRLDLALEPDTELTVRGVATDGRPLWDVLQEKLPGQLLYLSIRVVATVDPPGAALPVSSQRTYDQYGIGRYRAGAGDTPDVMGRLEIAAPLPVWASLVLDDRVLQTRRVEPGAESITFAIAWEDVHAQLGTVRLRVVDAVTLLPLTEALASLTDGRSWSSGTKPGADGVFLWPDEPPGSRLLELGCTGYQSWGTEVQVQPGGTADFGNVPLDTATRVSGVVRDADGNPQSVDLDVRPTDSAPEAGSMVSRWPQHSDEAGHFSIGNLGRREYELGVTSSRSAAPGGWTAQPLVVSTRGGDVDGLVIVVTRGSSVRLVAGWPSTRAYEVEVRSPDDRLVAPARALWGGDMEFHCLPPGAYSASLRDGATLVRSIPFVVSGDQLAVTLEP